MTAPVESGIQADIASSLTALEDESIHILREVMGSFERPVLLFSGGKDSAVVLRLAEKACWPGRVPFPVMHIDTGHNFGEVIAFRDRRVAELGVHLLVASVQHSIDTGRAHERPGQSRNRLQTVTLRDAIAQHRFDAVIGGARRDEEKARAKERIFSVRDESGQWDPRNQRPELWQLYNPRLAPEEHMRVFPLSNWTELDIWRYAEREKLDLPELYYAHVRDVFRRDGMLMALTPWTQPAAGETVTKQMVRYRTVGDVTCTAAIASDAATVADIIAETATTHLTERGATRADDRTGESAMEDRKREGYF